MRYVGPATLSGISAEVDLHEERSHSGLRSWRGAGRISDSATGDPWSIVGETVEIVTDIGSATVLVTSMVDGSVVTLLGSGPPPWS